MSARLANSISGKLLQLPASALLLMLALGTAAALHARPSDQSQAQAGTYGLLYSFRCTPDGNSPEAGLIRDSVGNLYGTTEGGGQYGYGTVFKVTSGGSTETVLHSFGSTPSDGTGPYLGSLTLDVAGNVYGTTRFGGEFGGGTVFKVTAAGTERVLYNFTGGSDGSQPFGGMARDSTGNLYGTTGYGGTYSEGVVFKLTPGGTESVLHSFGSSWTDGEYPTGNLTRDSSGNLYGTTNEGGASDEGGASVIGTVFEVTASGTESVLYSFKGSPTDGAYPYGGGLLRDTSGNLYGVTVDAGATGEGGPTGEGAGVVFKLTSGGTESVLLNFNGRGGEAPIDDLARDEAGNLYGTANRGGSGTPCGSYGCGVLFELTTAGKEIVLHNFTLSSSGDGGYPNGVLRDPAGNLLGTLSNGGAYGCGAVFKYTP